MTYRRSPDRVAAKRNWEQFVAANEAAIAATGLPAIVFASISHFDDLLSHGCLEHHVDPSGARVDSLDEHQYEALVMLVESYFSAGYEWLTPSGLRPRDCENLARRFDR
jgi:hypothetical protein